VPPIIDAAPAELAAEIRFFWLEEEWDHATQIAWLESGFNAFAMRDSRDADHPCGAVLEEDPGAVAEFSVGYFQINMCNFPDWDYHRLWNAHENAGTAHMLWDRAGGKWTPWLRSAERLGLL
jgi:hypothetical protein